MKTDISCASYVQSSYMTRWRWYNVAVL